MCIRDSICTVKLKNKDLSHLPVEVLTEEQLSAYSLYMRTLGNRPDLFGKAQYPNASTIKQPTYYDINGLLSQAGPFWHTASDIPRNIRQSGRQ